MERLHTVVVHYLDPEGNEYTNRVITDNPKLKTPEGCALYEKAYAAVGHQVLSVVCVDELPQDIQDRREQAVKRLERGRRLLWAIVVILAFNTLYDHWWRLSISRGAIEVPVTYAPHDAHSR